MAYRDGLSVGAIGVRVAGRRIWVEELLDLLGV